MQEISGTRVLALLRVSDGGEMRAADASDDLLRRLCAGLGLRRQSKDECRQLHALLLELAARGNVRIEFESADSSRIVLVALPGQDRTGDTAQRLTQEVERLRTQVGELQQHIDHNQGTVDTAEELIALAETAQGEATAALGGVQAELEQARQALTRFTAHAEQRISALTQKGVRDAATINELRDQVEQLTKQLKESAAQLNQQGRKFEGVTVTSSPTDRTILGCGCVVDRTSTADCVITRLEDGHAYMAVGIPNTLDPDQVAKAITEAIDSVNN